MRIGEAARASGLSIDTIRFYERTGTLPAPPRGANGYRRYTPEHVETLRLAAGLRAL
ncbi:MAG TPA: MerR family DNA-binding transcriptional regulator, partial [Dehalococcoidia bacterium]|nr:MerR family DNA-binding transcriptional regulator [Dehalococcoidia bacterium]